MRRQLVAALATCLVAAGCSDDAVTTRGDKYTLTVFAYDAVTGAPIDSASLASGLSLYEGADKVKPVVLDSSRAGAVIFKDVPADYWTGNKVYPIMADITGYQSFQGEVSYKVALQQDTGASTAPTLNDDLFAQVGYVHLWPVGFHAPDYTFSVVYNGKPVPNAAVQFVPNDNTWASGNDQNHGVIAQTYDGSIPALSGTTDANGKVTFAGANLVLGTSYNFMVAPIVFENVQLASGSINWITIGQAGVNTTVSLPSVDLVPGGNKYGLYVTSISNSVQGQVDGTGTLSILFSRPVALHASSTDAQNFSASTTGTGVFAAPPVNATLSADGLTLTLKPSWQTNPGSTDRGTSITYGNGSAFVTVVGYPADTFQVFGLSSPAGAISGSVNLTAP